MHSMSFKTRKQMLYRTLNNGAYFFQQLLVDGDESKPLRMANQQGVLARYRPLLTALHNEEEMLQELIN